MLSKNMSKYLDEARYLGFTATANYTVAQDIQKQLDIPFENFFSPVLFEKYNVRYDFREANTTEEMLNQVCLIAQDIIHRNERAIVFTKNDKISELVADAIGYEADVFTRDKAEAYEQFAEGLCQILVTSEELGIGINLPDVNCTVHFGMPVSKDEFVQEIGRAGRAEEKVTAYVIYLKPSEENIPVQLLKREAVIDNFLQILKEMNNDYADVYCKLNCGADTSDILYERLIDVYSDFHTGRKTAYIIAHSVKGIEIYKQLLYMLYVTGYIKDWYTYRAIDKIEKVELIIDICSVPNANGHKVEVFDDASMLERMRKNSRDYFASMGNDRESIFKVSKAQKIEDILKTYVSWYYDKFLYHHKEQFLDFFDFLTTNMDCDSAKITEELEDYFTLPFVQIKEDEEYYRDMTFSELSEQVINGIGRKKLANLERINSNNYSYKLDYLLFIGNWSRIGWFDANRLERFWGKLKEEEKQSFLVTMSELYTSCTDEAKWNYLSYIDNENNATGLKLYQVIDAIYEKSSRDKIFYGVMAKVANEKFKTFIRR